MKKGLILAVAILMLLALAARAQESRREVSAQGTVFFAKHSSGQGVSRETTVSPSVGSWNAAYQIGKRRSEIRFEV